MFYVGVLEFSVLKNRKYLISPDSIRLNSWGVGCMWRTSIRHCKYLSVNLRSTCWCLILIDWELAYDAIHPSIYRRTSFEVLEGAGFCLQWKRVQVVFISRVMTLNKPTGASWLQP